MRTWSISETTVVKSSHEFEGSNTKSGPTVNSQTSPAPCSVSTFQKYVRPTSRSVERRSTLYSYCDSICSKSSLSKPKYTSYKQPFLQTCHLRSTSAGTPVAKFSGRGVVALVKCWGPGIQ
eukprot:UN27362